MDGKEYSIYSEFDIEKHKKKYKNYLEVVILSTGRIEYAVPSHTEKLMKIAMKKYNCTREQINNMCPKEYYFDYITWLCKITNAVSVWTNFYIAYKINKRQLMKLIKLKEHGLYTGVIKQIG